MLKKIAHGGYDKKTKLGCTGFTGLSFFSKRLWSAKFALEFLVGLSPREVNQRFSLQHFLLHCIASFINSRSRGWSFGLLSPLPFESRLISLLLSSFNLQHFWASNCYDWNEYLIKFLFGSDFWMENNLFPLCICLCAPAFEFSFRGKQGYVSSTDSCGIPIHWFGACYFYMFLGNIR